MLVNIATATRRCHCGEVPGLHVGHHDHDVTCERRAARHPLAQRRFRQGGLLEKLYGTVVDSSCSCSIAGIAAQGVLFDKLITEQL